jgi:hypothetical protein
MAHKPERTLMKAVTRYTLAALLAVMVIVILAFLLLLELYYEATAEKSRIDTEDRSEDGARATIRDVHNT